MKRIMNAAVIAFVSIALMGCSKMKHTLQPSKKVITREYQVTGFNRIDASTVADLFYTQSTDSLTTLSIHGPENYVKLLNVRVENNTLYLTQEKGAKLNGKKLAIRVSTPLLKGIQFKGVGDVMITKGFSAETFKIESKGVGDIKADSVNCREISVESSGVGNVKIGGVAQKANLSSKGVGDIQAEELQAVWVVAHCQGVGSISCHAIESIEASVKGVGSIRYKGNPATKNLEKKGVGSISAY